jgi:drug/metabolite transporter (DMT)-like permease
VIGTITAFVGILIFLSDKFAAGLARAGAGDLVLLFAAFLFSTYTVIARPLTARYGPLMLLTWSLAFGAPGLLALNLPAVLAFDFAVVTLQVWLLVAWATTVSAFLGWLVWAWVNQVRGVARSAPLQYLMPPIAAVVSWLWLGEQFTWIKIGGAVIVMAGVAYAQFAGRRIEPAEQQVDAG